MLQIRKYKHGKPVGQDSCSALMQNLTQLTVPHIYTLWWVKSYENNPTKYPLPLPLSNLATFLQFLCYNAITCRSCWKRHFGIVGVTLAASIGSHAHFLHWMRWGVKFNPPPTNHSPVCYSLCQVSPKTLQWGSCCICLLTLKKDGISRPMFDFGDGLEADDMDNWKSHLYVKMNKLYNGSLDKDESCQKKAKLDSWSPSQDPHFLILSSLDVVYTYA